ncbi:hypothetical protein B0T20DRAFT_401906 [Sordaria brevicollis]|uniref:Uncharacterized protein n=1 Tax=Sordaria brevicollis TaxID=83679 RepID=A0AAE0PKD1_SORBR|nr:hypothetical protein B0T20DRAFT_401906 [Sordaria brevicollis]
MPDPVNDDQEPQAEATDTPDVQATPSIPQPAQVTPISSEAQPRRANALQYTNMLRQLRNLDSIKEAVDKSDWTSQAKTVLKIVIDEHRKKVTKGRGLRSTTRDPLDHSHLETCCSEDQVDEWIKEDEDSVEHFWMIQRKVNNALLREARERAKKESNAAKDVVVSSVSDGAEPKEVECYQDEVPREDGETKGHFGAF